MSAHTSRTLGTAYEPKIGMCYVEQLRPGSPTMRLIPVDFHPYYSNNPLLKHRSRVQFRTVNPDYKEAA